jgi:hypothetical protein
MDNELTDGELDALLARSAPVLPAPAARTAAQLARETSVARGPRGWWRQRSVRIGAAVGAALLLAGAGTMAAYELSIPPFQTTPAGVTRIQPGIPVEYTNSLGRRVECLVFMEFININDDQYARLAAIRESPTWVGWGDRTLRQLGLTDAPPDQQNREIFTAASEEMKRQAKAVIADLAMAQDPDGPLYRDSVDRPVFSGSAMSCTKPGGIDGQP